MARFVVCVWLALAFGSQMAPATEVFSTNALWRFRKGGSEASSPSSAWRALNFDDAAAGFLTAAAPFWYGDTRPGGTRLTDMQNSYTCIFLRRNFSINQVSDVSSLRLRAYVDDGFVAWINGVEVARANVSVTQPTYQTLAANQSVDPAVFNYYNLPAPAGYLLSGTNVLAVQVFNTSIGSSDLGFDTLLDVTIVETAPPVIASVVPAPGEVTNLTSITVTFSEPVVGLTVDDLLINGVPPSSMTASGSTFTFEFPQPVFGTVFVAWLANHGITDLATPPNPFNAAAPGATWQYLLQDSAPPGVSSLHPPAGLAVRSLALIDVTFNEPVVGVQASDLLVNNQPATNVSFSGGTYTFGFPPPQAGIVNVAWAADHGITDAAVPPNAFAGGNWYYAYDPAAPLPDVIISEFLAANVSTNGLADEDGETQDWIELYNRGTNAINLDGWSLSDEPDLPGLWTFPPRLLGPKQYLVVFASGKDRRSTNFTARLHTNFKLSIAGEPLGIYTPDAPRVLMHGFARFPEQRNDVSYGYDAGETERYFMAPTPGAPNGMSTVIGVCAPVHVNVKRGHFVSPFDLTTSCATPGAVMRYTTDGSEPSSISPIMPASLRIADTTLFRVAAFKPNHLPSKSVTQSYFFNLPAGLRSLPVLSIVTASNNLYGRSGILGISGGNYNNGAWAANGPGDYHNPSQHGLAWERPTSVEWIEPEDNAGFQVDCGIRVQGSDWQRPRLTPTSKFSLRLYFRSDYGPGRLGYPLFPLTPVQTFDQLVLRAGYNEQGNPFIRDEIHRRLSHDMGGLASHGTLAVVFINGVYYAGSPWYNPCERVHEEFFQQHVGGGNEWDVVGPSFAQSAGIPGVVDGDRADFQALINYVNVQNVTAPLIYSNIARRLDLTNFADYCLLNAYAATGDWPANNWRAGHDRSGGPWRFVVWDAEWGMGIYGRSITLNSFTQTGGGPNDSGLGSVSSSEIAQLYNRLRLSAEFRLLWADRVQKHFFRDGALTGGSISNRFMQLRNQLYPLMGEMDATILTWARDRQAIFFPQMDAYGLIASSNAPGFNQFGGRVPLGFNLVITNTGGTIYYTTDGSDPRTAYTGTPSPVALSYNEPVVLNSTVTIRARAFTNGKWSALAEATFNVGSLGIPLRISEIMYNPLGGSLYEFLELQNISDAAVDLSGMSFDGVVFQFDEGKTLAAGARLVLGSNTDTNAWRLRYPGVTPAGWFSGNLNNGGERLSLFDRFGKVITTVVYGDGGSWPAAADGAGRSLEMIDLTGDSSNPANWQASGQTNGSPGVANSSAPPPVVMLNEIMANNLSAVNHAGTFPDWIELYNSGTSDVSLAGWSLTDDGNARKFVFPDTRIPALGYLTVWCDAVTNTTPGLHSGFSLSRNGESVFLYDPTTNRVDAVAFGLQPENYSVGRVAGDWRLNVPTTNAPNVAAPLAPGTNLTVNEWLANPAAGEPDWIELFNTSTTNPVSLQGIYCATSNQLHQLTARAFLGPHDYLQLFADEGLGPDHLNFKLSASGDSISLSDSTGDLIQKIIYTAQAEGVSRGRFPDGSANFGNFAGSASPGTTNYMISYSGPVINEVMARNKSINIGGKFVDFIELFNASSSSFNLGGMSLSVNAPEAGEWTFPPNANLAAYSYLLIKCDGASEVSTNVGNFNTGEALDGESGGIYLFNTNGQLVSSVAYGPQVDGLSIGLVSGQWRLLSAPTPGAANASAMVLGTNLALRINEWMPNPEKGDDWFELYNSTNRPVDLSTISLSDDPSLAGQGMFRPAPLSFIGANGFVKWIADANPGKGRNHVNFALDGDGESLLLYAANGTGFSLIDSLGYAAHAEGISSGRLLDGQFSIVAFPGSPSPDASNYRLLHSVVLNEVLAHTDPPLEDAIELHNLSASPVSVYGWYLSNSRENRRRYQITNALPIPPGGYAVFYEYQFNHGGTNAFTLKAAYDDEVWLTATAGGVDTGERDLARIGASINGVSFGRIVTSQGVDFWPVTERSFGFDELEPLELFRTGSGRSNAAPRIGPVIISEILYHPLGGEAEFIELRNNTGSAVPLYDPTYPTNCWRLGGGVDYTFPTNLMLEAGEHLVVVDFDPTNAARLAEFQARYGIHTNIPVYGPFHGLLDNAGDTVRLYRPDTPQPLSAPDAGFVPYVIADLVSYTDRIPWPIGDVDGGGLSLQRIAPNLYGNEPLNWIAAAPTPGGANNTISPDGDGDGIPDWAEDLMGLNRYDGGDALLDPDQDGLTSLEEYRAGTDPLDSSSCLKFDEVSFGGGLTLKFRAVANHSYSVLYKDSPEDSAWQELSHHPATPVSDEVQVTDAFAGKGMRFYRLVTPALPP